MDMPATRTTNRSRFNASSPALTVLVLTFLGAVAVVAGFVLTGEFTLFYAFQSVAIRTTWIALAIAGPLLAYAILRRQTPRFVWQGAAIVFSSGVCGGLVMSSITAALRTLPW